jgi:hypothetical protein
VKRASGRRPPSGHAGFYGTELDRTLVSASTVVVSSLIPRTEVVRIRSDRGLDRSVRRHPAAALANPQFALRPSGLAIGVVEVGWRDTVLVPYGALRPYLSRLGRQFVAAARWPDFRRQAPHRHGW